MYQTPAVPTNRNTVRIVFVTIGDRTRVSTYGGVHGLLSAAIARCLDSIEDATPVGELKTEFDVHIRLGLEPMNIWQAEKIARMSEADDPK